METSALTVWTIGHSTRPLDEFLALLANNGVEAVLDVRRFPGSRRHPQYGSDALQASLVQSGVAYRWMESLGGRRRPQDDSPNTAWRNPSFRAYADYMQTEEFAVAFGELLRQVREQRTALMCAELVWWRCHRSLISDALKARGVRVLHIIDAGKPPGEHPYTAPARIVDGKLTYGVEE